MLFRPDERTKRIFVYALGVAARRFRIDVHGFCLMSTHSHIVLTDTFGTLPAFLQWFHRVVALAMKVHRRWEGSVWDAGKTSAVRLDTRNAFIDKLAYTLANPVAAGLVSTSRAWPGARTTVDDVLDGRLVAALPDVWFDETSVAWPPQIELRICVPAAFADDALQIRDELHAALSEHERVARLHLRNRPPLGARHIQRVSPFARATSAEPTRAINPNFATGRSGREALASSAIALREFRSAHRSALERWRSGTRNVVFPAGTWWMRVAHGVEVALQPS